MNLIKTLFHRQPSRSELAALRDRALIAETQVLLLRDMVEHPKRRREPRRDKQAVIEAKRATTEALQRAVKAQREAGFEKAVRLGAWDGLKYPGMAVSPLKVGKA